MTIPHRDPRDEFRQAVLLRNGAKDNTAVAVEIHRQRISLAEASFPEDRLGNSNREAAAPF